MAWGERRKLLERFSEDLLSDTAQEVLGELIERNSANPDAGSAIREARRVIEGVREHGLEPVFAGIRQQMLERLVAAAQAGQDEEWDWLATSILEVTAKDARPDTFGELTYAILAHADRDAGLAWIKPKVEEAVRNEADIRVVPRICLAVGSAVFELTKEGNDSGLDYAIDLLERALESFAAQEGTTVHGLHRMIGLAYFRRRSEDRRADLEAAERHLEAEISATPREVDTEQWGYAERMLGRVLELLGQKREALHHFELGTEIRPEDPTEEYLDARMSIASIRMDTYGEDRTEQLELSISELKNALEMAEEGSVAWARIHRNLGDAYRRLQAGDPSGNIRAALSHAELALSVFTRDRFPDDWAQLQHNLGTIHYSDHGGDRADSIELALACYGRALEVHTREAYPQYFGLTNAAMGMALLSRIGRPRSESLSEALERLEDAAGTLDREESKTWWAECRTALAAVYMQRLIPDRRQNLKRAIDFLEEAHLAYGELGNRQRESESYSNLAAAYVDLSEIEGQIHPEALQYAQAAAGLNREADPFDWATAQVNLAATLTRLRPDEEFDVKALECLERALQVLTEDLYPSEYSVTQSYVGHVRFDRGEWRAALNAYNASSRAGDALLSSAYTEAARREAIRMTHLPHVRATYCLLQFDELSEALVTLDAGKARMMEEALALATADLSTVPEALARQLQTVRAEVATLEAKMRDTAARSPQVAAGLGAELRLARTRLRDVVERVRAKDPRLFAHNLDADEILATAPEGGALVAFVVTEYGTTTFVIPYGTEHLCKENVLDIPAFTSAVLAELLDERFPDGWTSLLRDAEAIQTPKDFAEWCSMMTGFAERLWTLLLEPIVVRLRDLGVSQDAPLLLLPQGGLGLLPLHAAARVRDGVRRYLADDYVITYAPSAYWRQTCAASVAKREIGSPCLLAVVNPDEDLPFADCEGQEVTAFFGRSHVLPRAAACRADVLERAKAADYLHFASHGFYDWQEPTRSCLRLRPPEQITLSDLLAGVIDLRSTRLVTLSACETGLTDFRFAPDEYVGLPAGLVLAGAPGVVSALWKG